MFDGDLSGATAREYLRVSKDRSAVLRSPAQQHGENKRHAAARKWVLGEPYAETEALSASRYATRTRDDYERLVGDIESGAFGARILILYEPSRGSREVGEWVRLAQACERSGVIVYVTQHSRLYNPADARDRRSLLEDAVDAEYESAKISSRTRIGTDAAAEAGRPHGQVPFGYRRRYSEASRALIAQEPDPTEAPLVAELFTRLHAGESLRAVAADWEARGVRTRGTSGKRKRPPTVFTAWQLRDMATRAAYAGYRAHVPGRKRGERVYGLTGAVKGTWEPLVPLDVWLSVSGALLEPSRRTTRPVPRPGAARHLLSEIAACYRCGLTMRARQRPKCNRTYECKRGHVSITADGADELAEEEVFAYLERADVMRALRPPDDMVPELRKVRADLALEVANLDDWRAKARRGAVTADSFAVIEPGIVERITSLEVRAKALALPASLGGIEPGERVRASWRGATLANRRRALRVLFSPGMMGTLTVGPSPYWKAPAELRVSWVRKPSA